MQVVAQLSMQDLPEDVPGLSIRAREPLSEPFEVSVRFVSADPGRAVKDWLWTEAALQLQDAEGSGSRIFHDSSVPKVLEQLLSGAGLPSAAWDLGGLFRDHPARGYLTRWKESALTFRSRLLEDERISHAFTHADDGHVLVLDDGPDIFPPIAGVASVHPVCEWRAPPAGLRARGSLSGRVTR